MFHCSKSEFRGFLALCACLIFGGVALAENECPGPVCEPCEDCCLAVEDWCAPCVPGVNCPGEGGCAVIPPIPPAPNPPIADDRTFVTVVSPNPTQDCVPSFNRPTVTEHTIRVTRFVGEVSADGTLVDADAMIAAGRLGRLARLVITAWDVDWRSQGQCGRGSEQADVYFNGQKLGRLTGGNRSWATSDKLIPVTSIKFPKKGTGAGGPSGGLNEIRIKSGCGCWCHYVGWMSLEILATSPVFMLHGASQTNTFWDAATIDDALRSEKFLVNTELSQKFDTVNEAADRIDEQLPAKVKNLGVDSIHLVAHSKGGLDAITYLTTFCDPKGFCPGGFQVLSLTTLSTPFAGSSGSSIIFARRQGLLGAFFNFPEPFVTGILSLQMGSADAHRDLTVGRATARTIRLVRMLDDSDTVFNTIGADADDNGSGHLSRPEAAPGIAFFNLTGFLDLLASIGGHLVADIIYHNLSLVKSVRYSTGFFGLVVIIVASRTDSPQGNDIFATFNSAFGPQSYRDLVDRPDRAGHRKVYDGPEGRTHFDIADFGVGSDPDDEDVAEWLDEIERNFGDMRFRNFFRLEPF